MLDIDIFKFKLVLSWVIGRINFIWFVKVYDFLGGLIVDLEL